MQFSLFKLGALVAMAHTIAADNLHIETTHPPANEYKSHCTVIFDEPILGCTGSSSPFPGGCGGNHGVKKATMCGSKSLTVDWNHGTLQYQGKNGQSVHCTLSTVQQGGSCDTNDPDKYPEPTSAAPGLSAISALLGITPVVAGLLL